MGSRDLGLEGGKFWCGSGAVGETMRNTVMEIATEFRAAIERSDRSDWPVNWHRFPIGACGDAALLLGTLLKDRGCGSFEYVCGSIGESTGGSEAPSHAWLEGGGFVVDVTADQFGEGLDPVIVVPESGWHKSLLVSNRQIADFRTYDDQTAAVLGSIFEVILQEMTT